MTADKSAAEYVAEVLGRAEGATEGPWATYAAYGSRGVEVVDTEDMVFIQDGGVTYAAHEADAEFIAAARTDVEVLARGWEAVLGLHVPGVYRSHICSGCGNQYPCPTVRALTDAMTKEADRG